MLLSVVFGAYPLFIVDEEAGGTTSRAFFRWYWSTAPKDPATTWTRLTEDLRDEWAGRPEADGGPTDLASYSEFFAGVSQAEAQNFGRTENGWTAMQVKFTYFSGSSESRDVEYQVVCPYWTRLPIIGCDEGNAMLNDSNARDDDAG